MKRILFLYIVLFVGTIGLQAQTSINTGNQKVDQYGRDQYGNQVDPNSRAKDLDSTNVEIKSLPPKLYMWRLNENLGHRTMIAADTVHHQFQNFNFNEGVNGHYNHLANLGSPRLSRLFFERRSPEPTIFMEPLSGFFVQPYEFNFTNSNVPYTNLTYNKGGDKVSGEERFKSYFSVNVNKRLAFGFNIDYLYGRGFYNNQNTSYFNAALFGSYIGDKYQMQTIYSNNYLKTNENGGITDDRYITSPEEMAGNKKEYEAKNIPTVLTASTNRNKDLYIYLTHRYNLGFKRDIPKAENDTTPQKQEFIPVTSFIHTVKVERARHQFNSQDNVKDYYKNTHLPVDANNPSFSDSTTYVGIKNTIGIALLEGFNKYAKAGLTVFASYKSSKYTLMSQTQKTDQYTENEIYLGGELSKRAGKALHYYATGEFGMGGEALGQFNVKGNIDFNFKLLKDTVNFIARGEISNKTAPFYMRHYHSTHFWWDNNLDKEFRTHIEAELNIQRTQTTLKAGVENIKKYVYFNQYALPEQTDGNIQVLSATLNQNFQLGILHLDNEVTWQKSSDQTRLPLPDLSLYHNLYLKVKLAKKILSLELGADVRYFTEYYAPSYMPATQQFHLQGDEKIKIGNYPMVNVYANLHLKRTRFFVMLYHVNQGMGNSNYFLAPHYPINPSVLKFGLSWNLYD